MPISGRTHPDDAPLQAAHWICLIDCTLNGCDKVLVPHVQRIDAIYDAGSLRTGGAPSVGEGHGTTEMTVTSPHSSDPDRP